MDCPRCGTPSTGSTFCMKCRTRLAPTPPGRAAPAPPAPRPAAPEGNPAQAAALASVAAPLVLILLNAGFRAIRDTEVAAELATARVVLSGLVLTIGLVSGIAALAQMREYGREGVLTRALVGLVLTTGLLGLMGAGVLSGLRRGQARAEGFADLDRSSASVERLLEQAAAGEDVVGSGHQYLEKMAEAMRKAAGAMDEPDRGMGEALAEVTETAARALKAKEASVRAFIDAGGISPAGLSTRGHIGQRRDLVRQAQEVGNSYETTMTALPEQLRLALEARGVPASRIASLSQRYGNSLNLAAVADLCRTERDFLAAAASLFDVLESSFGRWKVDPGGQSVLFGDGRALAQYNALLARAQAAAAETQEIQKRALAARKAQQN